jgi:hypothetical protein
MKILNHVMSIQTLSFKELFLTFQIVFCSAKDIEMLGVITDSLVDWFNEGTSLSNLFLILTPPKKEQMNFFMLASKEMFRH